MLSWQLNSDIEKGMTKAYTKITKNVANINMKLKYKNKS